jgi:hypothetical protein
MQERTMTDQWTKAREAAVDAACNKWDATFSTTYNAGSMKEALDAAISALREHGYVVVPREPTIKMDLAAADMGAPFNIGKIYKAMLAAAEKERE